MSTIFFDRDQGEMMKKRWMAGGLVAASIFGMSTAQASLVSVGTGLVYDNVANVTWSSDANLFGTMAGNMGYMNLVNSIIAAVPTVHDTPNSLDTPPNTGNYNLSSGDFNSASSGWMDWWGGLGFVGYLNTLNNGAGYLNHKTWELPTTYTQTCTGYCANSMLGELFYTGLGGTAGQSITTFHNSSYNLFTNVQNDWYWSGEYTSNPGGAWLFIPAYGLQDVAYKFSNYPYLWAVLPGNATAVPGSGSTVPEPATLTLIGLGLAGLGAMRRRG